MAGIAHLAALARDAFAASDAGPAAIAPDRSSRLLPAIVSSRPARRATSPTVDQPSTFARSYEDFPIRVSRVEFQPATVVTIQSARRRCAQSTKGQRRAAEDLSGKA